MSKSVPPRDARLDEQIAYYRAIANEYEDHAIDEPGQVELLAAFDRFEITGDVLELACGPGQWTAKLTATAASITAVDASPEMLARARQQVGDHPVRFIEHDIFSWQPDRTYDAVFFGFWLSHVPLERSDAFWALVGECLRPRGKVFFVDDNHRTHAELVEGRHSPIVERRLNDGTAFRAIKVPHQPTDLEQSLRAQGWNVSVESAGPFYWGSGTRRSS